MTPGFTEVLARETSALAAVGDAAGFAQWRRRLVGEVLAPGSPYALVLRTDGAEHERAVFLDRWSDLLTAAVARVLAAAPTRGQVNPRELAMLILAAVHGGSILSRVARDPGPLQAALDLAFLPLEQTERDPLASDGRAGPLDSMAS